MGNLAPSVNRGLYTFSMEYLWASRTARAHVMGRRSFTTRCCVHWFLLAALTSTAAGEWPHHIYREDWKERTCSQILRQITHRQVTAEVPPRLTGQWASHRCEIRSGPQFVLRSYTFDGPRFESRIYHYEDADCSRPLYALVATGTIQLLQESWVIPGTMDSDYRLDEVQLVTYSTAASRWVLGLLHSACPAVFPASLPLKAMRRYTVLHYFWPHTAEAAHNHTDAPDNKQATAPGRGRKTDGSHDFDCTEPLNYTLNELQLLRLETRVLRPHSGGGPPAAAEHRLKRNSRPGTRDPGAAHPHEGGSPPTDLTARAGDFRRSRWTGNSGTARPPETGPSPPPRSRGARAADTRAERGPGNGARGHWGQVLRELLLGDVHTDLMERQRHRPTSFQDPLRDTEAALCGVCNRISSSDELDPPRLGVHQGTLLSLDGEWVSTRCESRQFGQFLTRWLHFLSDGQSWEGHYDYYHDALCRQPAFTLRAKGSYAGGHESDVIKGSKAYSFKTTRLKVTPHSVVTVNTLNTYLGKHCGQAGQWTRGREQDVTRTDGCVTLGIRLPSLEQDLMRMEAAHRKLLLYVSRRSSDHPVRPYHVPPPAAFQPPLAKCDQHDLDMRINSLPGEEEPLSGHALSLTSRIQQNGPPGLELGALSASASSRTTAARRIGGWYFFAAGALVVWAVLVEVAE